MSRRRWATVGLIIAAFMGSFAGSCDKKGLGDAPVGETLEGERTVIVMPDKFPNLALFCDGTTAIYVHTREAAPIVVADSGLCDGATPDAEDITDSEVIEGDARTEDDE